MWYIAILFKSRLEVEVINVINCLEGRFLIVECLINRQNFNLVNVCCPNIDSERMEFLEKLDFEINNRSNVIMAGDFNFVEDPILDKLGFNPNSEATSRSFFAKLKKNASLVDVLEPNFLLQEYTFYSHANNVHSRLDRFYIDKSLKPLVNKIEHSCNSFADHRPVQLTLYRIKSCRQGLLEV
jgi:exonuclease III